jgi:UPF0271 protein
MHSEPSLQQTGLVHPKGSSEADRATRSEVLRIDLNADLGEGVTDDAGLLRFVTSANVACGFHAGDTSVMRAVCEQAVASGVVVGAQVSYADREGFGRRPMEVSVAVLTSWVVEQVEALKAIAVAAGTGVSYLKAHGALYNRIVDDPVQAAAVLAGSGRLPVLTLPDSALARLARAQGRRVVGEGFPDRGYLGARLLPRDQPAEIAANAVALAASSAIDTVCVHGDSRGAVAAAQAVQRALLDAGYVVQSW